MGGTEQRMEIFTQKSSRSEAVRPFDPEKQAVKRKDSLSGDTSEQSGVSLDGAEKEPENPIKKIGDDIEIIRGKEKDNIQKEKEKEIKKLYSQQKNGRTEEYKKYRYEMKKVNDALKNFKSNIQLPISDQRDEYVFDAISVTKDISEKMARSAYRRRDVTNTANSERTIFITNEIAPRIANTRKTLLEVIKIVEENLPELEKNKKEFMKNITSLLDQVNYENFKNMEEPLINESIEYINNQNDQEELMRIDENKYSKGVEYAHYWSKLCEGIPEFSNEVKNNINNLNNRNWHIRDEEPKNIEKGIEAISFYDALANMNHRLLTSIRDYQLKSVSEHLEETWEDYLNSEHIKQLRKNFKEIEEREDNVEENKKEINDIVQSAKSQNPDVEMGNTTNSIKQMQKILEHLKKKAQEESSKTSIERKELPEDTSSSANVFPREKMISNAMKRLEKIVNDKKEEDLENESVVSSQESEEGTSQNIQELSKKTAEIINKIKEMMKNREQEMKHKDQAIEELKLKNEELNKNVDNLEEQLRKIKEEDDKNKRFVEQKEENITALKSKITEYEKKINEIKKQLKKLNSNIRSEKSKINSLEQGKIKLENANQNLHRIIKEQKKKLENQDQEFKARLEAEKQNVETAKQELEAAVKAAVEAARETEKQKLEPEKQQEEKLENKDNEQNKEIKELKKELEDLRQLNNLLIDEKEQLVADNQELVANNQQLAADNQELVADKQSLIMQVQRFQEEYSVPPAQNYWYPYGVPVGGFDAQFNPAVMDPSNVPSGVYSENLAYSATHVNEGYVWRPYSVRQGDYLYPGYVPSGVYSGNPAYPAPHVNENYGPYLVSQVFYYPNPGFIPWGYQPYPDSSFYQGDQSTQGQGGKNPNP